MEKKIRIAPSLLAADFKNLDKEIKRVIKAKANWLHLDVMDGHFVDNISFGMPILNSIQSYPIFKDVHLMIENPLKYINQFLDLNADLITFHIEALKFKKNVKELISIIHEYNVAVGIALKPETPLSTILPYLNDIDVVLIMSVAPGFGGQKFNETVLDKIRNLRNIIDKNKSECLIEVDGGVNSSNADAIKQAGANVLVAGSYLFKGENMKEKIKEMKKTIKK